MTAVGWEDDCHVVADLGYVGQIGAVTLLYQHGVVKIGCLSHDEGRQRILFVVTAVLLHHLHRNIPDSLPVIRRYR